MGTVGFLPRNKALLWGFTLTSCVFFGEFVVISPRRLRVDECSALGKWLNRLGFLSPPGRHVPCSV
jgi:hypothetical protein